MNEAIFKNKTTSKGIEVSTDSFYRGKIYAVQPVGTGHRSGSDALLIAACLPEDASGSLIDLGSGTGVAGLAALYNNPKLDALFVENNPIMVDFANRTLALLENNEFSKRAKILATDVTLSGEKRTEAGLEDNFADFVIMNPPYNREDYRPSPDKLKAAAHVMGNSELDSWVRTSAAISKPAGTVIMIYRSEKLGEIIACAQGRFGDIAIVPIHSREGEAAKRILIKMVKGSKAPIKIMPGIIMHDKEGGLTEHADALLNGQKRVDFS